MARIVVVDDEPAFRELATIILTAAGHQVLTAPDGAQGLDVLRQGGADLALLDVNMPGLTGFELCAELRRDPKLRRIPVMFLTVNKLPSDQKRGFDSGADDYLVKPFTPEELRARVFALLRRVRPAA